jgi:hypothetical protein
LGFPRTISINGMSVALGSNGGFELTNPHLLAAVVKPVNKLIITHSVTEDLGNSVCASTRPAKTSHYFDDQSLQRLA